MGIFNIFKPKKPFDIRKGTLALVQFDDYLTDTFKEISPDLRRKAFDLYLSHRDEELRIFLDALKRG